MIGFPVSRSIAFVCIDSASLQAYASWALVVLTFFTLLVLCKYAWDTRRIAITSMKQLQSSQTPFLALTRNEAPISPWFIENQGNSAALNIRVHGDWICPLYPNSPSPSKTPTFSLSLDPIPSGGKVFLIQNPSAYSLVQCKIEYSSLDDRHFITNIEIKDGNLISKFIRL